jgi:hypothetical protein
MMIGQPEPSWSLPYIASALIEQEILRAPSSGGNVRGAGSGAELAHATSILDANADHAQSHHPGRDIAQEWNSGKGADIPRDGQGRLLLSPKRRCDHSLLDLCLKGLNNPYRPFAFALNGAKLVGQNVAIEQGLGEHVRRHDGVLNRIVDSDAADGRHRVRRVADQQ